ncbi:hypothetical protein GLE_5513 [Lysobacter enzymogenes]|uniref:Uncharacterized protein n=1 Tax=Lysobacter enzymogenes TaxID=69 RepID=A0A0S2DQG4_LYSEN|nr:hypothetical protein GLE_5513 [Lysobacter enzymogenes]
MFFSPPLSTSTTLNSVDPKLNRLRRFFHLRQAIPDKSMLLSAH